MFAAQGAEVNATGCPTARSTSEEISATATLRAGFFWWLAVSLRILRVRSEGALACLRIDADVESSFVSSMYATGVAWVFMLTNSLRVLTYLPMMRKLLRPGIAAECQSQLTWLLWATANLSMTLHLFELAGREINGAVGLTAANTLMCCVCWYLVRRAQRRALQTSGEGDD